MVSIIYAKFLYAGIEGEKPDRFMMVGFADDEFNANEYLMLQKTLEMDEQDSRGMNKVYIEINDQRFSHYGGILKVSLGNDSLEITLSPSVAQIINSAQHVYVKFPKNHEQLSEVRSYLKRMFTEETDVFTDNTHDIQ